MTTGVGPESSSPTTRYHVSCPFHGMRPSNISGSFLEQGMMARRVAAVAVVHERRTLDVADLGGVGATRMEAAAARRVDRARYLALEHDPLTARDSFYDFVFDRRNRR